MWLVECETARRALARKLGTAAGKEFAIVNQEDLRGLSRSPSTLRLYACQVAPRHHIIVNRSNPMRDEMAYQLFIEAFAGAVIDFADDIAYKHRQAA